MLKILNTLILCLQTWVRAIGLRKTEQARAKFAQKRDIKLSLAGGVNLKPGWINIDGRMMHPDQDAVLDLSLGLPFSDGSTQIIHHEHFLEHLSYRDAQFFLQECYRILKKGGVLRIVIPDFPALFQAYVKGDQAYLKEMKEILDVDTNYYRSVYADPAAVLRGRKNNPPPDWQLSKNPLFRKEVFERARLYETPMEIVNYITHQYGEHKTILDQVTLQSWLGNIGFSKIEFDGFDPALDSALKIRQKYSLYLRATK